jgi:hypothetical protein
VTAEQLLFEAAAREELPGGASMLAQAEEGCAGHRERQQTRCDYPL